MKLLLFLETLFRSHFGSHFRCALGVAGLGRTGATRFATDRAIFRGYHPAIPFTVAY